MASSRTVPKAVLRWIRANNSVGEPHLQPTPVREPIYCRCCGTAILAERVEDAIVIKIRRNGKFHVAVVQCPRVRSC